jgi:hypothetical protein
MMALIPHMLEYWPLIVFAVGVALAGWRLYAGHEKRIRNIEETMAIRAVLLKQNVEDHVEIKTGLKDIHVEIVKLSDGVHDLAILVSSKHAKDAKA